MGWLGASRLDIWSTHGVLRTLFTSRRRVDGDNNQRLWSVRLHLLWFCFAIRVSSCRYCGDAGLSLHVNVDPREMRDWHPRKRELWGIATDKQRNILNGRRILLILAGWYIDNAAEVFGLVSPRCPRMVCFRVEEGLNRDAPGSGECCFIYTGKWLLSFTVCLVCSRAIRTCVRPPYEMEGTDWGTKYKCFGYMAFFM